MGRATFLLCFLTLAGVLPSRYAVEYEDAGNVYCDIGREFMDHPPSSQAQWYNTTDADECKAACTDVPKCHGVSLDYYGCSLYFDACFKSLRKPLDAGYMQEEVYLKKGMNDQTEKQYHTLQDAKKECLKKSSILKRLFKFVDTNNDDNICDDEVVDLLKAGALKYYGKSRLVQIAPIKEEALKHLPQPCSTFKLLVDTFVDQKILLPNPYLTPSDLTPALCEE